MRKANFIDRYFESEKILLVTKNLNSRRITDFMNYLENLHSLSDKMKTKYGYNLNKVPECILLRIIRNYYHHEEDFQEYQCTVRKENFLLFHYNTHLIIPWNDFLKAIKHFITNNGEKYVTNQLDLLSKILDIDFIDNLDSFLELQYIYIDNRKYELGIDLFKYVYNISNIIADKCRDVDELKNNDTILNLEKYYTSSYNIPKNDALCHPNIQFYITTEGFIFPKNVKSVRIELKY